MKNKITLIHVLFTTLSSLSAQQPLPKLIDQILKPLKQPREINNIIQEYMGSQFIKILFLKATRTATSRIFTPVVNCFNHAGTLFAQKPLADKYIDSVEFWDTHSGLQLPNRLMKINDLVSDIVFSCDDLCLIGIGMNYIYIWAIYSHQLIGNNAFPDGIHTSQITHRKMFIDGELYRVAAGEYKNSVTAHKKGTLNTSTLSDLPGRHVRALACSREIVLIALENQELLVWNVLTGQVERSALQHPISALAISAYATCIAIGYESGDIELYECPGLTALFNFSKKHLTNLGKIYAISFAKNFNEILIQTERAIYRYNFLPKKKPQLLWSNKKIAANSHTAFSPDHKYIATGTNSEIAVFANPLVPIQHPTTNTRPIQKTFVEKQVRDRMVCAVLLMCVVAMTIDSKSKAYPLALIASWFGSALKFNLSQKEWTLLLALIIPLSLTK